MDEVYPLKYTASGIASLESLLFAFDVGDFDADGDLTVGEQGGTFLIDVWPGEVKVQFSIATTDRPQYLVYSRDECHEFGELELEGDDDDGPSPSVVDVFDNRHVEIHIHVHSDGADEV